MATIEATPPGAERPSTVLRFDPPLPPVAWSPHSGEFQTFWGYGAADALSIPAVWRARQLISQSIGGMPLGAWRKDGTEELDPIPRLLDEPNLGEDRCSTVAAWVCDLLDHGNAFGVVAQRDAENHPVSVVPVSASRVWVRRVEGRVEYQIDGGVIYDRRDVFHAKGTHRPGDLRGMGVLEAGLSAIARMGQESAYASRAFTSGTPAGIVRVKDPDLPAGEPTDEPGYTSAHGIKKAWHRDIVSGDVAVLSDLVDFEPLAWTPSDAQMVEARQMSLVDAANLFNLDPYWLGASQVSAPYQNVQQAALQLSRFGLGFWITVLEAQFSRMLPRGTVARFNRDTILREESSVRADTWVKLLGAGVVAVDEVRQAEGWPSTLTQMREVQ